MEIHSGLGISAENVSITLDGHRILNDVSVVAEPGKVTALVGPNGAGKSTLLAALSGDHELSGGDVRIGEHSIACLLYTSPSPRDRQKSRMPSSA